MLGDPGGVLARARLPTLNRTAFGLVRSRWCPMSVDQGHRGFMWVQARPMDGIATTEACNLLAAGAVAPSHWHPRRPLPSPGRLSRREIPLLGNVMPAHSVGLEVPLGQSV